MQRKFNGYVKSFVILLFLLIVCLIGSIKCGLLPNISNYVPYRLENQDSTSTGYRYKQEFKKTLQKYPRFNNLYQKDISTAIPGLQYTELNGASSSQMVPQGICIAGDYMLLTAYDSGIIYSKDQGTIVKKRNSSVIYILTNHNPQKRELLTTMVLPDANHVGGIAFDGRRVWIAKSTAKKCSIIEYEVIERAARSGQSSFNLADYCMEVSCGVTASFLTYYDGKLWIGTYRSRFSGRGSLQSYVITGTGFDIKLKRQQKINIPAYANGVTFAEIEGNIGMAVTTSRGRYGDSKIYLYEVENGNKRVYYRCKGIYSFPPMAEELVWDGENTYFLFESAATCYSTLPYRKCSYPVDRICGISTKELFYWERGIMLEAARSIGRQGIFEVWAKDVYLDKEKYLWILKQLEKNFIV